MQVKSGQDVQEIGLQPHHNDPGAREQRYDANYVGGIKGFLPRSLSSVFYAYVGAYNETPIVAHVTVCLQDDLSMSTKRAGKSPACSPTVF